MTMSKTKALSVAAIAGFALASGSAFAQTRPPAAAPAPAAPAAPAGVKVPLKAAPEQSDWLKVCGPDPAINKTICYTTRDFVAENNQPVMAVAVYAVKDDTRRFMRYLVPLSFMIQPGIRFSVEGTQPINARFQICLQQGCFVEGEINDAFVNAMKKAKSMRVDMQNQVGQEVNFEVPLAGFAKLYDSAGIDQETLLKQQQGQATPGGGAPAPGSDELKKRAEEMLRQRQGGGTAPKP